MDERPYETAEPITVDSQKPVAYDTEGRPLYAAPVSDPPMQPQVVHMTRAVMPEVAEIPAEVKRRNAESRELYPMLNLSDQEYIISEVHRHPIAIWLPILLGGFMIALIISMMINYSYVVELLGWTGMPSPGMMLLVGTSFAALIGLSVYAAVWIHLQNTFFLTNESVIQEIQTGLFSHNEQTVSLGNIEDASYTQNGVVASMFDYGSIRLSTEGDETTYRFEFVHHPKQEIAKLNNAIEAFKNGRPVEG